MNIKWTFRNGVSAYDCTSFPYAFRMAFNTVRKALDNGESINRLVKGIQIVGPPNVKGDPLTYSYESAANLATAMGLLLPDGTLNQKEYKRKKK